MVSAVWRGLVRYTAVLRSWAEISIFHPATAKYRGLRSGSCGPPALDRAHGHLCYKSLKEIDIRILLFLLITTPLPPNQFDCNH